MAHAIHGQQNDAITSRHNLTFFMHHGPDTVPDEPASPESEHGHSNKVHSLQHSRPAIPPRRSSRSILNYVRTKYTDSASGADYSSSKSSSPVESKRDRDLRRHNPIKQHLSRLGRRRAENNDAFRPLEREITSTYRSGMWSFETSSEESIAHEVKSGVITLDEAIPDPFLGRRAVSNVANPATSSSAQNAQSRMDQQRNPCDAIASLVRQQQFENLGTARLHAIAARHASQPSVQAEVALQIFKTRPADAENERTGQVDCPVLSTSSSTPPSHIVAGRKLVQPVPSKGAPELPAEFQPDSVLLQQDEFAQANLINSQTQWSHLSHWSDEFDQFPESQQETTIQRAQHRVEILRQPGAQQPGPSAEQQLDLTARIENLFAEKDDRSEVHCQSLSSSFEPAYASTTRISLANALEAFEVAAETSRDALFDPAEPGKEEQTQMHETDITTTNQPQFHAVPRQLLPLGVAARNAQYALGDLPQILEPINQLIFEEQSRAEGLRLAVNENMYLRQELKAAHLEIAERDREIARLRVMQETMRGQAMPLLTASFHPLSTATQVFPAVPPGEQTQERINSHEAPTGTFALATEPGSPGHTPPQLTSRVPVYDHFLPDQRVIPRVRLAFPRRQRRRFVTDGNDADQGMGKEENSDLHEST